MISPVVIDIKKCIGCGHCVEVCPVSHLVLDEARPRVLGTKCIACGHCVAICPNEAIALSGLDDGVAEYATFRIAKDWLAYGKYDVASLVSLMRSRRSCRNFLKTPVDLALLEDLTQIGVAAPSGTNCRSWMFTILADRAAVLQLIEEIRQFFQRLNNLARRPLLRFLSRLAKGKLDEYYRQHFESVEKALADWHQSGKDQLFFNAPAVIVVGSRPGASTPAEDALLATQNILLAAHCMGLGTCLIGFAVAALKRSPKIRESIGIPKEEAVHAVIAIGHTDRSFHRITGLKKADRRIRVGNRDASDSRLSEEVP